MQKKSKNANKKTENARSILKFMQKRAEMQKKQKMPFNLKIHVRKGQKWKKESTFIWNFFCFNIPCAFFCISNLKIHIKKDKNAKKAYKFFQIAKIKMQKKA